MKKHQINYHLDKIKLIQADLNQRYTQAMINLDAMNQRCGGKLIDGNYVMDREQAIEYFANGYHKVDYCSPDAL